MSSLTIDPVAYARAAAQVKFKNIAALTDFSPCSSSALNLAVQMARYNNSNVSLIHAIEPSRFEPLEDGENVFEQLFKKAESNIREEEQKLEALRHDLMVHRGTASELLQHLTQLQPLDVVVLGTIGMGCSSKDEVLGRTARQILTDATFPVLTVGCKFADHECFPELTHILVPMGAVSEPSAAISYGELLAAKHQAHLALLQVVPSKAPPCSQEAAWMKDSYRSRMSDVPLSHSELKYPPQCLVEFAEDPAEGVLRVAEKFPASLIVLEKSAWKEKSLNSDRPSTYLTILLQAPCPVLTVSEDWLASEPAHGGAKPATLSSTKVI